jgi:hypothetical protein
MNHSNSPVAKKPPKMRGIFDSEQGWMRMLRAFAARASAT